MKEILNKPQTEVLFAVYKHVQSTEKINNYVRENNIQNAV